MDFSVKLRPEDLPLPPTAKVWDADKGTELLTLKGRNSGSSVCFGPDGHRILTGSWDQTAKVWNFEKELPQPVPYPA